MAVLRKKFIKQITPPNKKCYICTNLYDISNTCPKA